ncbi:putative 3-methyladenine DNA glycosylase [Oceaniferula spumae]|uniref:Putative 3-methyladenine DNA glycosylase n=1 Tax=Oceaniferula spumae TaxID=2979115 RepID=A0AAT9FSS6_9BACT
MISREFYLQSPQAAAQKILGGTLSHGHTSGMIVETEAYSALDDQACHTYFRPKIRRFVEDHPAGTAYIYLNYGMHWLFNLIIKNPENGEMGFVLVRALEPIEGIEEMQRNRDQEAVKNLCSGPAKLTQALSITSEFNGIDTTQKLSPIQLSLPDDFSRKILIGTRIGITKSAELPWRYGLESSCLSKPFI